MFKYGSNSLKHIETLHPHLQLIAFDLIEIMNVSVVCGHRGKDEQDKAVAEKKSKTPWPKSKHNQLPSIAMDVIPYPTGYKDTRLIYFMAGLIKGIAAKHGITIRWGGDWDSDGDLNDQTFNDLVHFELIL